MKTVRYKCHLCNQEFELPEGAEPVCPICGATGEHLEVIETKGDETMNKYKGTKTEQNLMAAFAGESQARNKYTYFASKAIK